MAVIGEEKIRLLDIRTKVVREMLEKERIAADEKTARLRALRLARDEDRKNDKIGALRISPR